MISDFWKRIRRSAPVVVGWVCLLSCQLFDYSPYEIPTEDKGRDRHAEALLRLAASDGPGRSFSFAVIADIQSSYDELETCVGKINEDSSIRFVLVDGDLTQYGLLDEFKWVKQGLDGLKAPYLTVLGNHDVLANGVRAFQRVFGPLDYTFTYRGAKFVAFNDNVWGFDEPVPNLRWLDSALDSPDSLRLLPVAHIPPWGDQIEPEMDTLLTEIFRKRHTTLCIFAHQHNFHYHPTGSGRRPYVLVDNVGGRNFVKISLGNDTAFTVDKVFY